MSSTDYPLRVLYERLRGDVDALLRIALQQIDTVVGSAILSLTATELRLKTSTTFPQTSAIITEDGNGNIGFFKIDPADTTTADDGYTVIVDASARRWKRQNGLV